MTMDPIPMPHASRQPPEGRDEIREATASFTRMIAQAVLGYQRWAEQPREVLVRQNEAWVGGQSSDFQAAETWWGRDMQLWHR